MSAPGITMDKAIAEDLRKVRGVKGGKPTAAAIGISYALLNRITCNYKLEVTAKEANLITVFLKAFRDENPGAL